jgi:soluble lytic murein transglycosylase-like protein
VRTPHPLTGSVALVLALAAPAQAQLLSWGDSRAGSTITSKTSAGSSFTASRAGRETPFDGLIDHHASLNGVDVSLVRAVIQAESAFNPRAVSPKGAAGLMQLMPSVIADYDVVDVFDPADNIRAGVAYLSDLLKRYDGNVELALAAYNAGPGAVDRHGGQVPPYRETRQYVAKIQQTTAAQGPGSTVKPIYRVDEEIDGRIVPKFTDRPEAGATPIKVRRR